MKPNYGMDAPGVVRNLFLLSLILAVLAGLSFFIPSHLWFWIVFLYTFSASLLLGMTGCWMLYGIKIEKPRLALRMIRDLHLRGDEKALDLGCGRGLFLCKMAKSLPQGMAYGIDLWSVKDQSGNSPENTLQNAYREGVRDRVSIQTGNVCSLPFSDNFFDVVISGLCLHNLRDKEERRRALSEMLRVLKPGGKFAIMDIRYGKEYAGLLSAEEVEVKTSRPSYAYCPPVLILEGVKR